MQHYQDYVNYMIRDYFSFAQNPREWEKRELGNNPHPQNPRKINVLAVKKIFEKLDGPEQRILTEIFGREDTISDNIYQTAKQHKINQDFLWKLLKRFTRDIAKERGLI